MFSPYLLAQEIANAGFLPTRGSFMLDFVFLAMFGIMIVLGLSVYLVRKKRAFQLHKRIQLVSAAVLLITIVFFEIDLQLLTDWRALAEPSAYYANGVVGWALAIHLMFAIPTPLVWAYTIIMALKRFPEPPQPNDYSPKHRFWGWTSTWMMVMTTITGWIFYVLAFVM